MADIADGLYAYRFKGFALDPYSVENFVVGIGTLHLTGRGITGEHRSTFLRLTGTPAAPTDGRFTVNGTITNWDATEGSGTAHLIFTQQDEDPSRKQKLEGDFAIVQASSSGEYWLTSLGKAKVTIGQNPAIDAAELVEGELRWLSA